MEHNPQSVYRTCSRAQIWVLVTSNARPSDPNLETASIFHSIAVIIAVAVVAPAPVPPPATSFRQKRLCRREFVYVIESIAGGSFGVLCFFPGWLARPTINGVPSL